METNLEKQVSGMTDSYKNNTMQIAVFSLDKNSETKYGINVNKIKSFVNLSEYKINKNIGSQNNIVKGYSVVRNETFPVIDLYEWLSGKKTDTSNYEKLIITEFNGISMAFPVSKIFRIFSKTSDELEETSVIDKVTYITKIELKINDNIQKENKLNGLQKQIKNIEKRIKKDTNEYLINKLKKKKEELEKFEKEFNGKKIETSEEELCFVLDVEKIVDELQGDVIENELSMILKEKEELKVTKPIMIAEDSIVAQNILKKLFNELNIPFEMFKNGKELINRLSKTDNYSMVITDIEMPILDGFSVIKWIKENKPNTYIIVNTSMSNEGVKNKCKSLGVDSFIQKTKPKEVIEKIKLGLKNE